MSSKPEFPKEQENTIILSERDAELVFSLIENPPPPNEKLKAAAAKHRQFFHNQKIKREGGQSIRTLNFIVFNKNCRPNALPLHKLFGNLRKGNC